MGRHKDNPLALIHQAPRPINSPYKYGYGYEVTTEPNKAKMAEITAMLDKAKADGLSPQDIDLNIPLTPDETDYVVYHRMQQFRESLISGQTKVANIRGPEHFRCPLKDVMDRADLAFNGGPGEAQG